MITLQSCATYRDFLRNQFEAERASVKSTTLSQYAKKFGLSGPSFHSILAGKRNLTVSNLHRVARALGLSANERDYFESLVLRDQAEDRETKNYYESKLKKFSRRKSIDRVRVNEKRLLSHWFVPALLIYLIDFEKVQSLEAIDYGRVAVKFNITPDDARRCVETFHRHGLLAISPSDKMHIVFDRVTTKLPQKEFVRAVLKECSSRLDENFSSAEAIFRAAVFTIDRHKISAFKSELLQLIDKHIEQLSTDISNHVLMQGCLGFYPIATAE